MNPSAVGQGPRCRRWCRRSTGTGPGEVEGRPAGADLEGAAAELDLAAARAGVRAGQGDPVAARRRQLQGGAGGGVEVPPPVQLQLVLWIDSVPLATSIVPPLRSRRRDSVRRAAAGHLEGALVRERAAAGQPARAADVVSRPGLVIEGAAVDRQVAGAGLVDLALVDHRATRVQRDAPALLSVRKPVLVSVPPGWR